MYTHQKNAYAPKHSNTARKHAFWEQLLDQLLFLATCFAVVVAFAFVLTL